MTNKIVSILFLLSILPFVRGQAEVASSFDFYSPKTKLYVIGESHFENDGDLQITLLDYITSKTNVDVFIFELPEEVGIIFNDYVLYGTRESDINAICSLVHKKVAKKIKMVLEYLKVYNLTHSHKIKIAGIDDFHFHKLKRQMKAMLTIFPEVRHIESPLVQKYIVQQKVKNLNRKKSTLLIKSLIDEATQHQIEYHQQLGDRLDTYHAYLSNLEFRYINDNFYALKKTDSTRESTLAKNLVMNLDSTNVCFMICGAAHASLKVDDSFTMGYPFTSMTASANQKFPSQIFSINFQYYDKNISSENSSYNLLSRPMTEYVKDQSVKYVVIDETEIQNHPRAKERNSMIIIQNKLYRPKSK